MAVTMNGYRLMARIRTFITAARVASHLDKAPMAAQRQCRGVHHNNWVMLWDSHSIYPTREWVNLRLQNALVETWVCSSRVEYI